jgi:hypothetical protein
VELHLLWCSDSLISFGGSTNSMENYLKGLDRSHHEVFVTFCMAFLGDSLWRFKRQCHDCKRLNLSYLECGRWTSQRGRIGCISIGGSWSLCSSTFILLQSMLLMAYGTPWRHTWYTVGHLPYSDYSYLQTFAQPTICKDSYWIQLAKLTLGNQRGNYLLFLTMWNIQ